MCVCDDDVIYTDIALTYLRGKTLSAPVRKLKLDKLPGAK